MRKTNTIPKLCTLLGKSYTSLGMVAHDLKSSRFLTQYVPLASPVSIQRSRGMVDDLLVHGASVLGALGNQKDRLKGAQHKMLDLLNTIGVSASLLRVIDRRCAISARNLGICFRVLEFLTTYMRAGNAWTLFWCMGE